MNYKNTVTTTIAKIIGSFMTITFSLVAFAHGQSCQLLPGWSPSTLADGQSRTGYQIPEATYTQSCTGAAGLITCVSGSVVNGNIFTYSGCTPQTWLNCTIPTGANHLEYKTLYKANHNTYTQSCQQLSQSLQCLNGVFTGGITPLLYGFASCTDQAWAQCIDVWTNSYKDHGQSIIGYIATSPGVGQTCTTLKKTLTCTNSFWSGNGTQGQVGLFSGCTNGTMQACPNIITYSGTLPHGSFITKYTNNFAFAANNQYCTNFRKQLQCVNGVRSGNQGLLFTGCQNVSSGSCLNVRTNTYISNFQYIYGYITSSPGVGQTCTTLQKKLICQNTIWAGYGIQGQAALSSGCINPPTFAGCMNSRTNTIVPHSASITAYTSPTSLGTGMCSNVSYPLICINGGRSGGVLQSDFSSGCVQTGIAACSNIMTNIGTLPHGTDITMYNRPFAYQANNQYCSDNAVHLQCINSNRSGLQSWFTTGCQNISSGSCYSSGVFTPNFQSVTRYTSPIANATQSCSELQQAYTCVNGTRSGGISPSPYTVCGGCSLPRTGFLAEGHSTGAYSTTSPVFPKSCDDFSTTLSCDGGILNGNWQTYKYNICTVSGALVIGTDLAINESPGLPGQENTSGGLIAQGSSPQIGILFKNKGNVAFVGTGIAPGFLQCTWDEVGINVYKSNTIDSFVVNGGTKVGINIRIKSIFTQAVGFKTLKCTIDPNIPVYTDVGTGNNIWEGTFEIVEADRFDLALSRSIELISKNLEAAEGAKGTQGLQNFLFNKIMNVLVPLIIIIGILSAILGFYKIMFSSEDTATKEGVNYILYGVIGIILIMSARFIGQNVYDLLIVPDIQGNVIAVDLYNKIIYPFIKFAIYLVLGAMFVILLSRVITFLFGTEEDAQKKAGTIIGRNVISMLVIIGAKQIIEAIYGKQAEVVKDITNLGEVGSGILADKNIPILYQVINYALGMAALVILVVIIVQTIQLLMKPDDSEQVKKISKSLLYMFIGILILGAGYLIVNFAIIN